MRVASVLLAWGWLECLGYLLRVMEERLQEDHAALRQELSKLKVCPGCVAMGDGVRVGSFTDHDLEREEEVEVCLCFLSV